MAINMGLVGCGDITHVHGSAIEPVRDKIRFAACCDINLERAEEWARQYGADRAFGSIEEMLEAGDLEAVQLATWPNLHRDQIEICLRAGIKHILCEKALTVTGAVAVEIWDMVNEAGAVLMEGFMYRHHPAIRRMERSIAAGEIGEVDYVRAAFNSWDPETIAVDDPDRNWRQRPECAGGVPYDFACYAINACGHFAGAVPVRVSASGSISEKYEVMDRLFGFVEYANGKVGIVASTKKADFNQELAVSGGLGILRLPISWTIPGDITVEREFSVDWANPRSDLYRIPKANPYTLQLDNFADLVTGKADPVVPLCQSVVNAYVTEGLVESAKTKADIKLDIPDRIVDAFEAYIKERT